MSTSIDFDFFFQENYESLVRSLTAITGDREAASDAVQEAFVRAYARWHHVCRTDNPVTWVRRVAINRSRDVHRSETRRRRREDRVEAQPASPPPPVAERVEDRIELIQRFNQLSSQQRAVAVLYYLEDLSVADIGASLDISAGAVKFHLNRARAGLKAILERERETAHA